MRRLFVHHHIGLGDHFDCNALVRYVYHQRQTLDEKGFDLIHVFSKDNHFSIIDYMYRDNEDIIVEKIDKSLDEYVEFN